MDELTGLECSKPNRHHCAAARVGRREHSQGPAPAFCSYANDFARGSATCQSPPPGFRSPHPEERSDGSRLEGRGRATRYLQPSFETAASPPPQDEVEF